MKTDNSTPLRISDLTKAADLVFEAYEFGDGVIVVDADNWNSDDSLDLTKIVYVTFSEDPDCDSVKVSFHVRFDSDGQVTEGYALLMSNGAYLGNRGYDKPNTPPSPKL